MNTNSFEGGSNFDSFSTGGDDETSRSSVGTPTNSKRRIRNEKR